MATWWTTARLVSPVAGTTGSFVSDSPNVWHEPRKLRRMQVSFRASCKYRNHVIRCVCVGEERDGLGRNAAAAVRATQPGLLSPGKGH
jgi:hypothetical protein